MKKLTNNNGIWYQYIKAIQTEPGETQNLYHYNSCENEAMYEIEIHPYENEAIVTNRFTNNVEKQPLPEWVISERERYQRYAQVNYSEIYNQCRLYLINKVYIEEKPIDNKTIEHVIEIDEFKDRGLTVNLVVYNYELQSKVIEITDVVFYNDDNMQVVYAIINYEKLEHDLNMLIPEPYRSYYYNKKEN